MHGIVDDLKADHSHHFGRSRVCSGKEVCAGLPSLRIGSELVQIFQCLGLNGLVGGGIRQNLDGILDLAKQRLLVSGVFRARQYIQSVVLSCCWPGRLVDEGLNDDDWRGITMTQGSVAPSHHHQQQGRKKIKPDIPGPPWLEKCEGRENSVKRMYQNLKLL